MKRKTSDAIFTTVLMLIAGIIVVILGAMSDLPWASSQLVIIFIVLFSIGWLTSTFVVEWSYNKSNFTEIEEKFSRSAKRINEALQNVHVTSVHNWIVPDPELFEKYESKVPENKAIIVVTPTFRNDYPQGDDSTGIEFVANVAGNIARGVKYRYIAQQAVAAKHFENLIRYHNDMLVVKGEKLKPGTIKVIVTSVPQITEMVFYPLTMNEETAFTIIKTKMHPIYKTAEYNVKMVGDELHQFKDYLKYVLNLEDTKVWEFNNLGRHVIHDINENDRDEFFTLTGVPV